MVFTGKRGNIHRPATEKAQHSPAARHHEAPQHHRGNSTAQTAPQDDSRTLRHSATQQHSTTEHNTGEQGTTANHTNHREAGHTAREGHRHRNTPPEDIHRKADPAPHHRTPKETAQHTATQHSTRRQKQRRPHDKHNASAPAQCGTALHRGERTGNAQRDSPGHTQHKAQGRTTAGTNTPPQNTHSTEHTARGNTTKHSTLSTPRLYPRAGCRVRSPGRQVPGTANRRCTNSVGCAHVPVPSTIPRDPAAPSTGRLGPGNGQRPPVEDG